jgi:hypothetical protein
MARKLLCAIGVVISVAGSACTTTQTANNDRASFKSGCAENVYLTGPRFNTCNNI